MPRAIALLLVTACDRAPDADHLATPRPDPVATVDDQRDLPEDPEARRRHLVETARDPLALAGAYTAPVPERPPMGVVMCDALAGQAEGPVMIELLDVSQPGAPLVEGQAQEGRLVLYLPLAKSQATITFPSGLTQEVAWDALTAGRYQECRN